jgi:hypothetical protein
MEAAEENPARFGSAVSVRVIFAADAEAYWPCTSVMTPEAAM